jgi:hypothetical protein
VPTDNSIVLAACEFATDYCSANNELAFSLHDETTTDEIVFDNLTTEMTCSYKITASSGAPGFNIASNLPTEDLYVAWVEYDMETVTAFDSQFI